MLVRELLDRVYERLTYNSKESLEDLLIDGMKYEFPQKIELADELWIIARGISQDNSRLEGNIVAYKTTLNPEEDNLICGKKNGDILIHSDSRFKENLKSRLKLAGNIKVYRTMGVIEGKEAYLYSETFVPILTHIIMEILIQPEYFSA